ncbi:hypothetical protein PCA31118_00424 [Pandoraea captiosa]|uniref:Uncharacterized protein n=1 Tax=Pandoraea captiosa TaxID=2508302 RepID=A0A5E4ZJ61_9BURK|nr:hypothetical protein PCA31118_00424 [Pandoraea captiosa]
MRISAAMSRNAPSKWRPTRFGVFSYAQAKFAPCRASGAFPRNPDSGGRAAAVGTP